MLTIIKILLFLGSITLFVILGVRKNETANRFEPDWTFKVDKKNLFAIIPLILLLALSCVTFVPANTVGIKYSAINGTSNKTLSEGIAFKTPFDKIYTISTTVQERTIDKVSVQTKDAQFLTMQVNVKYKVNSSDAFKIYKGYKTLEELNNNIIGNYAQKSIEGVVTKYNVIEVLGEKKSDIYELSTKSLKDRLQVEGVELVELIIKDMDAGEEIEASIKAEAVAKKAVETAEQNRLKASKDAETKVIETQGQADANAIMTEALTDKVLKNKLIEKWNGIMPIVSGGNETMLDISSIIKDK